jgi:hypothetical protein
MYFVRDNCVPMIKRQAVTINSAKNYGELWQVMKMEVWNYVSFSYRNA